MKREKSKQKTGIFLNEVLKLMFSNRLFSANYFNRFNRTNRL